MTAVDPLLNAASWTLAANLTRAHPDFQIRETHPGGGLYDCLTLVDDRRTVWINRAGSIRIEPPRDAAEQVLAAETWQAAVQHHAGQRRLAEQILAACHLRWPTPLPPATPAVLTYRVAARLLANQVQRNPPLDVRSQFLDTSGPTSCDIVQPVPSAEMAALPAREVWRVLDDKTTVAWLWNGWAWTGGGERRDLVASYDSGATLDDLVELLTSPTSPRRAPVLPLIDRLPAQPTGYEA